MGEYVLNVVGVALAVGILEELLPNEYGSKVYVRLLTGLCLLLVMLAPVGSLLRALPDMFSEYEAIEEGADNEYERILSESLGEQVREQLAAAVRRDLSSRFGVNSERAEVGIMLGGGDTLSVSRLVITLRGADILKDPYEIEDYFSRLLDCECAVIVG